MRCDVKGSVFAFNSPGVFSIKPARKRDSGGVKSKTGDDEGV